MWSVQCVQSQGQSHTEHNLLTGSGSESWSPIKCQEEFKPILEQSNTINNLSRTLFMFFNLIYFSVCVVKREVENRKHDRRNALLRIFSINNIFISRSAPIKMQIKSLGLWKLFLFKFCTRYLTTYLTCFLKLNKLQTPNWYLQLYLLAAGFWYFKKFNQSSFYVK